MTDELIKDIIIAMIEKGEVTGNSFENTLERITKTIEKLRSI